VNGIFFATSHGKSACHGIGGTIKRATAKASLQRTFRLQILSCQQMYTFCCEHLGKSIKFLYITCEEISEKQIFLEKRYDKTITVVGTHGFHRFVSIN